MDKIIYLDNSSTTKQYEKVTEVMLQYMTLDFGNPSSLHRLGLAAEKGIRQARMKIADGIGADGEEIYFTSGGTEANNMALFGACQARKRRGNKIITTQIEHPAVMERAKHLAEIGFEVVYVGVDNKGFVDMAELEAAIDDKTILISVMQVNNEVGTIEPIHEICKLRGQRNFLIHTDAVQAFGKMPMSKINVDLMSLSGHKIHGPKGSGALYIKKGVNLEPCFYGGGQERQLRPGTENVPAIIGFGEASEIAEKNLESRISAMKAVRNYLLSGIKTEIEDIKINGSDVHCCPSILNISFLGTRGEVILHALENEQIYVSTGSACSSNKKGQSYVLKAMGLKDKEIEGAIRFSFNEFNTIQEMDFVLSALKREVGKFRKLGSFR